MTEIAQSAKNVEEREEDRNVRAIARGRPAFAAMHVSSTFLVSLLVLSVWFCSRSLVLVPSSLSFFSFLFASHPSPEAAHLICYSFPSSAIFFFLLSVFTRCSRWTDTPVVASGGGVQGGGSPPGCQPVATQYAVLRIKKVPVWLCCDV